MHPNPEGGPAPEPVAQPSVPATTADPGAHSTGSGPATASRSPEGRGTVELEVHPLALLFPEMSDREYAALKADIELNGQREEMWLYEGKVLDGRNRLRANKELGREPRTRPFTGPGSALEFVISLNLHRRHLKETQRAMIAAKMLPKFEEEARKREHAGVSGNPSYLGNKGQNDTVGKKIRRAADDVGKLLNVSYQSVYRARKVLDHGCPALIEAVAQGKLAVRVAATLAERAPEQQEELLAQGRKAIAEALRNSVELESCTPAVTVTERRDDAPSQMPQAPPPTSLSPLGEGRASVSETEGEGHLAATQPANPPPDINSAQHSPIIEQRIADEWLLDNFRPGNAKLTKDEWGFRLEFSGNPLDAWRAALCDERQLLRVIERGFRVVWKP